MIRCATYLEHLQLRCCHVCSCVWRPPVGTDWSLASQRVVGTHEPLCIHILPGPGAGGYPDLSGCRRRRIPNHLWLRVLCDICDRLAHTVCRVCGRSACVLHDHGWILLDQADIRCHFECLWHLQGKILNTGLKEKKGYITHDDVGSSHDFCIHACLWWQVDCRQYGRSMHHIVRYRPVQLAKDARSSSESTKTSERSRISRGTRYGFLPGAARQAAAYVQHGSGKHAHLVSRRWHDRVPR